jgi:hypothetical protein
MHCSNKKNTKATTSNVANQISETYIIKASLLRREILVGTCDIVIFRHKVGTEQPICFIDDITQNRTKITNIRKCIST